MRIISSSFSLSSLELSDKKVYELSIRARLGTAAHTKYSISRVRIFDWHRTLQDILAVIRCVRFTQYSGKPVSPHSMVRDLIRKAF